MTSCNDHPTVTIPIDGEKGSCDLRIAVGSVNKVTMANVNLELLAQRWSEQANGRTDLPGRVSLVLSKPEGYTQPRTVAAAIDLTKPIGDLFARLPGALMAGLVSEDLQLTGQRSRRRSVSSICSACHGFGVMTEHQSRDTVPACTTCQGTGFIGAAAALTFAGQRLSQVYRAPLGSLLETFHGILPIRRTLEVAVELGLDTLTLLRTAPSLSSGEALRLRVVEELGKKSPPTLRIFEQPTRFLSSRQAEALLSTFKNACNRGDTVVIVNPAKALCGSMTASRLPLENRRP